MSEITLIPASHADVAGLAVRRALPKPTRRLVGAWCFLDHFGPAAASAEGPHVGPHPHIGLQTVTWLVEGETLHRDSLGSEQLIRPGQLNLMTAAAGIAHAEESTGRSSITHGAQLWVALPERTRHGAPGFEHHESLPTVTTGSVDVTVLVGELLGARSDARTDTPLVGADLDVRPGATELPLRRDFEHALVVFAGRLDVEGTVVEPGSLAYLPLGRDHLGLAAGAPARAMLIGGEPLGEEVLMGWNFVARTRDELAAASRDWNAESERFGRVASTLTRIPAPAR